MLIFLYKLGQCTCTIKPIVARAVINATDLKSPLTPQRLSALRHDLRTPFNQIIGYAEMAVEEAEEQDAKPLQQAVAPIIGAAHDMLAAIDDLLSGEPDRISPAHLAAAREQLAPRLERLLTNTDAARRVAETTELADDTRLHLSKIQLALEKLEDLMAATATWHDAPQEGSHQIVTSDVRVSSAQIPRPERIGSINREPMERSKGFILIVDDQADNRELLRSRLHREGFEIETAASGDEALDLLRTLPIDLVLLDVMMPGMDGTEVLKNIKLDPVLSAVPVIMLSAVDEIERVVQCIEGGAEDYLPKPFNPVLLRARIGVALERKRLHDEDARKREELTRALAELTVEREKARRLLLNILPERIADDLQHGNCTPMYFEDATICFTDFVGFTLSTESMPAEQVVEELHTYFTAFDHVMERYGLEKLKTIGDSYMFASGVPKRHPANPINAVLAAFELAAEVKRLSQRADAPGWELRIGLHTGPLIAGVVGIRKFAFDVWGDSVNAASRMESSGKPGCINISDRTYARVKDFFVCEPRGKVMTKDKREVDMFFVRGAQPSLVADGTFKAFSRRYKLYFSEEPPAFPPALLAAQTAATKAE
jgi:class 3 adenylate cyclase